MQVAQGWTIRSLCTVEVDGKQIVDVPLHITAPLEVLSSVEVCLEPTAAQFHKVSYLPHGFSIQSVIKEGEHDEVIDVSNCFVRVSNCLHYPHGQDERKAQVWYQEFGRTRRYKSDQSDAAVQTTCWLTPCRWAEPDALLLPSYTGEVSLEKSEVIRFHTQDPEINFEIDLNYTYMKKAPRVSTSEKCLVLQSKGKLSDQPAASAIDFRLVDDLCWLLSLASRRHVACLLAERHHPTYDRLLHRNNIARPESDKEESQRDYLISRQDAESFIQTTLPILGAGDEWSGRVRSAIANLVATDRRDIQASYIGMFSALEELLELFAREKGEDTILPAAEFEGLRSEIKKTVVSAVADAGMRAAICEKIPELNRPPVKRVFDQFMMDRQIKHSDLWPVMSGSKASLRHIRNRLVHGKHLSSEETRAVAMARLHLKALLERCVLSLLGWSWQKSDVSMSGVGHNYVEWKKHASIRADLEKAWSTAG